MLHSFPLPADSTRRQPDCGHREAVAPDPPVVPLPGVCRHLLSERGDDTPPCWQIGQSGAAVRTGSTTLRRWRCRFRSTHGKAVAAVKQIEIEQMIFACRFGSRNALHRTHEVILQVNSNLQTYLIGRVHGTKCSRAGHMVCKWNKSGAGLFQASVVGYDGGQYHLIVERVPGQRKDKSVGLGDVACRVVRGDWATRLLKICQGRDGGGGACCCCGRARWPRDQRRSEEVPASPTFRLPAKSFSRRASRSVMAEAAN